MVEACHIIADSITRNDTHRVRFWTILRCFWSEEECNELRKLTRNKAFQAVNILVLERSAHRYWGRGWMGFLPVAWAANGSWIDLDILRQSITITRDAATDSYHVARRALVFSFRLLFLREPGPQEGEYRPLRAPACCRVLSRVGRP
jgi:hypothetical protein